METTPHTETGPGYKLKCWCDLDKDHTFDEFTAHLEAEELADAEEKPFNLIQAAPVTFHNHGLAAECNRHCYALPGAESTQPVRLKTMPHTHIFQYQRGLPGCPACDSIDPLKMMGDPRRNQYVVG